MTEKNPGTKSTSLVASDSICDVYHVLIIEDNPALARTIENRLSSSRTPTFTVEHRERLDLGLERLSKGGIDVILLDLNLPDSDGVVTLLRVHASSPKTPIVVLSGYGDATTSLESVNKGAEEYLTKGEVAWQWLPRILQHAIVRNRQKEEIRHTALMDSLTGLYNRRGFSIVVDQQLLLARRERKCPILLFLDVNNFKQINDTYGHSEGDEALVRVARVLRATFRESDVMARFGGDEFAVLAITADVKAGDVLVAKFREKLKQENEKGNRPYQLSLSHGVTVFDPKNPCLLEELLRRADQAMYRSKRKHHTQKRKRKKVEVIEDDEKMQKVLGTYLQKLDLEFFFANDGKQGLKLARSEGPDLILLDLTLPELSGEEVCKAIREDHDEDFAKTPIIILTAKTGEVDKILGKVIGANQYLTKPFDPETLLTKVHELVQKQE